MGDSLNNKKISLITVVTPYQNNNIINNRGVSISEIKFECASDCNRLCAAQEPRKIVCLN